MSELNETKLSAVIAVRNELAEPPVDARNPYRYHIGIELELENVRIQPDARYTHWQIVEDGSLRNGKEFITSTPIRGATVAAAINEFYGSGVRFKNSPRTSTHVHVNVTDMKVGGLRAMFVLSYALEDSLFRVMDDSRKYCGYCMPLSEMHPIRANKFLSSDNRYMFADSMGGANTEKYYGFNINSIRKHGTAEFRYFPGGPDQEELKNWIAYCVAIRHVAETIGLEGLRALESETDMRALVEGHFGEMGRRMLELVGVDGMWASLQEVLNMMPEVNKPQRVQPLVFLSDALGQFVGKHYLKQAHKVEHFNATVLPLKVVSRDDWFNMLDASNSKRLPKKEAAQAVLEEGPFIHWTLAYFDYNEEHLAWQESFGPVHVDDAGYLSWVQSTHRMEARWGDEWERDHRDILKGLYTSYLSKRKKQRADRARAELGIEAPIPPDFVPPPMAGRGYAPTLRATPSRRR